MIVEWLAFRYSKYCTASSCRSFTIIVNSSRDGPDRQYVVVVAHTKKKDRTASRNNERAPGSGGGIWHSCGLCQVCVDIDMGIERTSSWPVYPCGSAPRPTYAVDVC